MFERFLWAASGDENLAAALLARGLMQGDPETFKVGYSRESAVLAALEAYPGAGRSRVEGILTYTEPSAPEAAA
jgi:hypothetical protein